MFNYIASCIRYVTRATDTYILLVKQKNITKIMVHNINFIKWSNNSLTPYGSTNFGLSFVLRLSVMFNFDHTISGTGLKKIPLKLKVHFELWRSRQSNRICSIRETG